MQVLSLPVWNKQINTVLLLVLLQKLSLQSLQLELTVQINYNFFFFAIAKFCIAYPKFWIFEIHGWSLFLIKCPSAKIFHILYISQQTVL